jgi:hypothetical protein
MSLLLIAGGATAAPARGRASIRGSEAAKHKAMPTASRPKKKILVVIISILLIPVFPVLVSSFSAAAFHRNLRLN